MCSSKQIKELAEICEIAKSKGMSYGQYMAEQYKKEVMIR